MAKITKVNFGTYFHIFVKNCFIMNLHEYQAKELLKKFNVPVQEGIACNTATEAEEAYRQIHSQYGSKFAVVKAQIHAGGRGKGTITGTEQRGVAVGGDVQEGHNGAVLPVGRLPMDHDDFARGRPVVDVHEPNAHDSPLVARVDDAWTTRS